MTLIEKIEQDTKAGKKFLSENPNFNSLWLVYNDVPLEEIRQANDKFNTNGEKLKPSTWDNKSVMMMQLSNHGDNKFTVFAHSVPIKVTTHFVEDNIIENI